MRVAVITLTRDRLGYTKYSFDTLRENAGCDFDWYIADQASTDGTPEWLLAQDDLNVMTLDENIGVCRALNLLLTEALDPADYDVIVRFDNDCEVTRPDTLKTVCELAHANSAILAPHVLGLRNPPAQIGQFRVKHPTEPLHYIIDETSILGGIFMAIPASLFTEHGYTYDESFPIWAGDEAICAWWRAKGGRCGYVQMFSVNHYLTTDGQHADIPAYFARSHAEGKPGG